MDQAHKNILDQALASPEGQKFQAAFSARADELKAAPGFAAPSVNWLDVVTAIGKVAPAVIALIGHFTPAGLIALIPSIVTTMFPGIDSQLAGLIQQFLTYVLGKIPIPTPA